MADLKITQLTELAAAPDNADILAIVDDVAVTPITKKITVANLLAGVSAIPALIRSTIYEYSGRFVGVVTGGGSNTFSSGGVDVATSATISSSALIQWYSGIANHSAHSGSPTIATQIAFTGIGTDLHSLFCVGTITIDGSGITYTANHFGFKITRAASGTINLYATQADGTTETASAALTTVGTFDDYDLIFKINGTASVDYYWRVNGGALSTTTNLTTNMGAPTFRISHGVSNVGVATASTLGLSGSYHQR